MRDAGAAKFRELRGCPRWAGSETAPQMAITDIMAGLRDMLDIDDLMTDLARVRGMFHSEADFQHALAWQIHEASPQSQVRLEVDVARAAGRRMYLDIWLPEERIAIELKYLTRRLDLTHRGERFALRDHAQDLGRYEFLKDVQRLEVMRSMPGVCGGRVRGAAHQRPPVLERPGTSGNGRCRLPDPRGTGDLGTAGLERARWPGDGARP